MKRNKRSFVIGFVLGAFLFGTTAYAAEYVISPQKVYVNGVEVKIEGYNIDGRNYYQLRDLSMVLDFPVSYDRDTDSVYIGEALTLQEDPVENAVNTEAKQKTADVSVQFDADGRALPYKLNAGDVVYGTGNVSKSINPYAADSYDGYMTIKTYSKGVPFPDTPLRAINPLWDESYYAVKMPNPVPCYTHILPGEQGSFMGMETEEAKEVEEMYIFNAYETQRIIDALYDAFLEHPECYTDGKLNCTVRVGLTGSGFDGNFFYPYQEHCVTQTVGERNIDYMVYAVDTYTDGVYMGTKYCCIQNCSMDNPDVISSDTAIMKDRQYK